MERGTTPVRIDPILAGIEKAPDSASLVELVEIVRRNSSENAFSLIEQERHSDAAKEFAKIELAYTTAIERIETFENAKDLEALKTSLQDAAEYWKGRSERSRSEDLQSQVDKAWNEGREAYTQSNYDKALESLTKALDTASTTSTPIVRANILIDKGNTFYSKGDYEEALSQYKQALCLDPKSSAALRNKGLALYNLMDYKGSIETFDEALKLDKDDANVLTDKGRSLIELGKEDEALECLNQAIEINPQDYSALFNRGIALNSRANAERHRGEQLKSEKDYKDALKSYDLANSFSPNDTTILREAGRTCKNLKDYDKAKEYFNQVVALDPTDSESVEFLAIIAEETGQMPEALKYYSKAIELHPDNLLTSMGFAEAQLLSSDHSKSEETAKKTLAMTSNPLQVYVIRLMVVCSRCLRGIQGTTEEAVDLLTYYKSFPSEYYISWDFACLREFIQKSQLSEIKKKMLDLLMVTVEEKRDAAKAMDDLKSLIKQEESIVNRAVGRLRLRKTKPAAEIDFSTKNTAARVPGRAGWYDWTIFINEPPEKLAMIQSVTYVLHPTFPNPQRTVTNREERFQLKSRGWGSFRVKIIAKLGNGKSVIKYHWLDLSVAHRKETTV